MKEDKKLPIIKLLHYDQPIDAAVEATGAFTADGQVDVVLALKEMNFWLNAVPKKIESALVDLGHTKIDGKTAKASYLMGKIEGLQLIEQEVRRDLCKGFGYSDIPGHGTKIETRTNYKPYNKWQQMMRRCFTTAWHDWKPTYKGCSIDPEWLVFSNFKRWYDAQPLAGKYCELDKDIIIQGNKHYSPETCVLVTAEINSLLKNYPKGSCLRGVKSLKNGERFSSSLSIKSKPVFLGSFDTEIEAHNAYVKAKEAYIQSVATQAYNEGNICAQTLKGLMDYSYSNSEEAKENSKGE